MWFTQAQQFAWPLCQIASDLSTPTAPCIQQAPDGHTPVSGSRSEHPEPAFEGEVQMLKTAILARLCTKLTAWVFNTLSGS